MANKTNQKFTRRILPRGHTIVCIWQLGSSWPADLLLEPASVSLAEKNAGRSVGQTKVKGSDSLRTDAQRTYAHRISAQGAETCFCRKGVAVVLDRHMVLAVVLEDTQEESCGCAGNTWKEAAHKCG